MTNITSMADTKPVDRYGSVAMAFHWLIAIMIFANVGIAMTFEDFKRGDPVLLQVVGLHKSIGLTILSLSVLRLAWRLTHKFPALPSDMTPVLKLAARSTHILFYVFTIVVPLAGWAFSSASSIARPISFFGLFNWPLMSFLADMPRAQRVPYHEALENLHVLLAWAMVALAGLHIAAALYHQFIRRDDILRRMIPGTKVGPAGGSKGAT